MRWNGYLQREMLTILVLCKYTALGMLYGTQLAARDFAILERQVANVLSAKEVYVTAEGGTILGRRTLRADGAPNPNVGIAYTRN